MHCHKDTVCEARKRLVERGFSAALERKKRGTGRPYRRCFDGEAEARLIALACSAAPEGRGPVDVAPFGRPSGSARDRSALFTHNTVHEVLKKTNSNLIYENAGLSAPEQDADFVAAMEDVLSLYHRPYDPEIPMVCMDEQPVQLTKETRLPLPMESEKPERYDYEYERNGTASIFMFSEPKARNSQRFRP